MLTAYGVDAWVHAESDLRQTELIPEYMQKLAVERARSGEIGIRPSERRRQVEEAQLAAGGGSFGAPKADGYGALTLLYLPASSIMLMLLRAGGCVKSHVQHTLVTSSSWGRRTTCA